MDFTYTIRVWIHFASSLRFDFALTAEEICQPLSI